MKTIFHRPSFPLVVSAYTVDSHLGDYYKQAAQKLCSSCVRHDLPHVVFPLRAASNWIEGCSFKPAVIAHALKTFKQPILWLDADAIVLKYPSVFEEINSGIALHVSEGGHWLSGTLCVAPDAFNFVLEWETANKPSIADEITLLQVYRKSKSPPLLTKLPSIYNQPIYATTDQTKVSIGHFVRKDVADIQGRKSIPVHMRP